jgi:hypothetical protein
MFAGGTCSVGSSTSTTDSPHDRFRVSDPHGLRADQRWPNRAVIAAAVLAVVALVVSIIAAIPTVKELLGL